jgi:hypothetical protein
MLDFDRLHKFQKAFERLADPHSGEGTRIAALRALFNMCQTWSRTYGVPLAKTEPEL